MQNKRGGLSLDTLQPWMNIYSGRNSQWIVLVYFLFYFHSTIPLTNGLHVYISHCIHAMSKSVISIDKKKWANEEEKNIYINVHVYICWNVQCVWNGKEGPPIVYLRERTTGDPIRKANFFAIV